MSWPGHAVTINTYGNVKGVNVLAQYKNEFVFDFKINEKQSIYQYIDIVSYISIKSSLYIGIKYIEFGLVGFYAYQPL